jgi:hypothetical protein
MRRHCPKSPEVSLHPFQSFAVIDSLQTKDPLLTLVVAFLEISSLTHTSLPFPASHQTSLKSVDDDHPPTVATNMDDTRASHTVDQPTQPSKDHTFSQTSHASAPDQSQPCLRPAELILEITADGLSKLPSQQTVDVHADWLIRVYGPILTALPPAPSIDVSELDFVKTKLEEAIATHLRTENKRWINRAWNPSARLCRATARVARQCEDMPRENVTIEPRTEMHSFAGSRMTGGSRFQPGFNGGPSYTDYPAAIVYPKYRSLLPEDMKRQMPKEWLEEGSEIASAPPPTEE